MKPLSMSHLVIAAVLAALTTRNDAQVTVKTLESSQDSFICGEEQILICEIEPYLNTMTWSKDGSPIPLASCSFSGCSINPSMSASYNFTFDTGNGIFHMEILTVKVTDNGTIYSCANGFETDSVTSYVTVSDDFTVVNDSKKIDSNTTEVSVTTGCIHNDVAKGVKFEWWLQEVNNTSPERRNINESKSDTMYDSSVCLADPDCGVSRYSFITNSVNITDEGVGKTYRIGVDIISGVTLINSISFDLFFIRNYTETTIQPPTIKPTIQPPTVTTDTNTEHSAKSKSYIKTILIASGAVCGVIIFIVILVYICTLHRKQTQNAKYRKKTQHVKDTKAPEARITKC